MRRTVDARRLRRFSARVFLALGLAPRSAARSATVLAYADERGIDTHGVANLPTIYAPRLRDGRIDPSAEPRPVADLGATAVLDARNGIGLVAAARAIDLAVEKARRFGIGAVGVCHSSHFGAAGYYAARAARRGFLGVAATNLGRQALVPPPGGAAAMLGTNPIAVAAPAGKAPGFVLDMSTTAAAAGKVRAAARRGEPVPAGWLTDLDGRPVTDPATFDRGASHLAWLGGVKGYGLGLAVEFLCGVLTGAGVGPAPAGNTQAGDQDVGHFLLAIDVKAFGPDGDFAARADELLADLVACPPRRPGRPVTYPGLPEHRARSRRLRRGVPLDGATRAGLVDLARSLGIEPPAIPEPGGLRPCAPSEPA